MQVASPFYTNPAVGRAVQNLGLAFAGPDPHRRAAAILTGAKGAQAVNQLRGNQAVGDMIGGLDVKSGDVTGAMQNIYAAAARYGLDPQKVNVMLRGAIANSGGSAGQVISSLVGSGVVPNVNSTVTREDQLQRRGEVDAIKRRGQDVSAYATMNRPFAAGAGVVYDPRAKAFSETDTARNVGASRVELNKATAAMRIAQAGKASAGGDPMKGIIKPGKYDAEAGVTFLKTATGVDDVEKVAPKLRENYYSAFSYYLSRPTINGQPNPAYKNHALAGKAAAELFGMGAEGSVKSPNERSFWNPRRDDPMVLTDKADPHGDKRLKALIGAGSRTAADVVTGAAAPVTPAGKPPAGMDPLPRGLGGKIDAKRLQVGRVYQTPRGPAVYRGNGKFEAQ